MALEQSQWTLETLKEHILAIIAANDRRYSGLFDESKNAVREAFTAQQTAMQTALTAQKLAVDMAQAAADRAVTKSEAASDKRFDSVNEFRSSQADLLRTYMPRAEAEIMIRTLSEKIEANTKAVAAATNQKTGLKEGWAYLIGGAGIIGVVASIIFMLVK